MVIDKGELPEGDISKALDMCKCDYISGAKITPAEWALALYKQKIRDILSGGYVSSFVDDGGEPYKMIDVSVLIKELNL